MLSRRNNWKILVVLLVTQCAHAGNQTQDLQALEREVQAFVEEQLSTDSRLTKVTVKTLPMDSRLKMPACEQTPELTAHNISADSTRATVKVSCQGPIPWSLYASATVDGKVMAAVASHSLARGQILDASDVALEERSLTELPTGYLNNTDAAVGMQTKRTITSGEAYKVSALKPPLVVRRGDAVVVEANTNSVAVVAPGIALADGTLGQQIRVKNSRSDRTIKAVVMGPGRVEIKL